MLLQVQQLHTVLSGSNGDIHAVQGIDLTLERSRTTCLVGESGSGKSVTALSIMRLLPDTLARHPEGRVLLADENHPDQWADLLQLNSDALTQIRGQRIAMIFQEPMSSLNPVFTIGEQITEALTLSFPGMSAHEARTQALQALCDVQIVDAETRFNEYPHRLSGGQRQRVMIAMALVCKPDLLIADEPTTALDVTVQAEILELIAKLQRDTGMAMLFITHDLGVVSQIADNIAVMRAGKIVEQGLREQVLFDATHTYTKGLLAALPENLQYPDFTSDNFSCEDSTGTSANDVLAGEALASEVLSSDEVLLEARNLKVYFPVRKGLFRRVDNYVKAVDGVSLKIRCGEVTALVGESGSGKSTFGRAIVRLLEPTAGQILYRQQSIGQLSARDFRSLRSELQIVFQDPLSSLNPRLTIANTLTEPMAVHGIGESHEQRLDLAGQLLADVNLPQEYLWRYPHEFSGGQRQRIGIARALAVKPNLIVCDEVTSALDVSVQAELLQLLLQLRARLGLTLLFITHNISVVEYISDKTAVLYQGQLVEYGDTTDVCGNPRHEYTQKLLAAVPRVHGQRVYYGGS